jgi:putative SOS response-associated peptidase YedK
LCNLYSLTKGQAAIRDLFRAMHDRAGNLPLLPGIFPDQTAPIVRNDIDGERELVMARWGYAGAAAIRARAGDEHPQSRQPALAGMAGPAQPLSGAGDLVLRVRRHEAARTPIWFALDEDRPLFAFAGLWTAWRGVRGPKGAPVGGEHQLFGFLTTEANATNATIAPIHPKAMPVILFTPRRCR